MPVQRRAIATAALVVSMGGAGAAFGQCGARWSDRFDRIIPDARVRAMTLWDPDGAGPAAPVVIVGTETQILSWDGSRLTPIGTPSHAVSCLTTWDPDGAGPLTERLVAGGLFESISGVVASRVAVWDGSAWSALGGGVDDEVAALAVVDFDGDGPGTGVLFAGGRLRNAEGQPALGVAAWDGARWSSVGGGVAIVTTGVRALAAFDPDGEGPAGEQLIVGGAFLEAGGGVAVSNIARWDGSAWHGLGTGVNSTVKALHAFDEDGDGPAPARLFAGGNFTSAGETAAVRVARWDGEAWSGLGPGWPEPHSTVVALTTMDLDGAGGEPARLVAAGQLGPGTGPGVAAWDGSAWSPVGGGVTDGIPMALLVADDDGYGPDREALLVGGEFNAAGGFLIPRLARWSGSAWSPLGYGLAHHTELDWIVPGQWALDPDGAGPDDQMLMVSGYVPHLGSALAARGVGPIGQAAWNGEAWIDTPSWFESIVWIGDIEAAPGGPGGRIMVAGVGNNPPPGVPAGSLVVLDDEGWTTLPWPPGRTILSGTFVDDDGDGADLNDLHITFDEENGNGRIARWNSTEWSVYPGALDYMDDVGAYFTLWYDPDDGGPEAGSLVILGTFLTIDGEPFGHAARWTGTAWAPMGGGLAPMGVWSAGVRSAVVFRDTSGAQPRNVIVVWGSLSPQPGEPRQRLARWDGAAWTFITGPLTTQGVGVVHDPDGAGPASASLYTVCTSFNGVPRIGLVRWDGAQWETVGGPFTNEDGDGFWVRGPTIVDEDGDGPLPAALYFTGDFTHIDGVRSSVIARWGIEADPYFTAQPAARDAEAGDRVTLAGAAAGTGPISLRWRRDGVPLVDGGRISGAASPYLVIDPVEPGDSGTYNLAATGACGEAVSDAAVLTVGGCRADWNSDGAVNSSDIGAFLAAWLASVHGGTLDGDFSGDLAVNSGDIGAFLTAWLAGVQGGC